MKAAANIMRGIFTTMKNRHMGGFLFISMALLASISAHAKYQTLEESYTRLPEDHKCIEVSYDDAQRLMKIAAAEAGDQGPEGQLLVMRVVWNRVKSPNFPDTIEGVLSQKSQFETYRNGMYENAEPNIDSHLALAEFEKNLDPDKNIIGFETVANEGALLQYFDYAYTVGNHDFYKLKR